MVQFTKLKLSGFKSFLYPTEIEIGPGKTGVVGPNGCGKSNLLEALGWVMGETSAKRLRGDAMDDVIFNGTGTKASRSTAEVTLVLDNSKKGAPPQFNSFEELEITRKIERGIGSDYTINGKSVRAKDVQMLFADLVSGANSPALVSQGRITAIIQAKAKDRRRILEDAAGISGLHARRHEAELKLRATSTNLERLEDIVGTMGTQLDGLKKQARLASRYRNLSDHIRNAEATVLYLKWWNNEQNTAKAKQRFNEIESQVRDKLQITTQLSTKQAEFAAKIPDLRKAEVEVATVLQRFIIEKENLDQEEARTQQTITNTKQEIARLTSDIEHEQSILNEQKQRIEILSAEKATLENVENNIETIEQNSKEKLANLNTQLRAAEIAHQEVLSRIASKEAQKNSLQNQKIGLEGQIARLENEKIVFDERLEGIKTKIKEQTMFDGLKTKVQECQDKIDTLRQKRDTAEDQKQALDIEQGNARIIYQEAHGNHTKLGAEAHALETILKSGIEDDFVPVLDEIDVQKGYETALAAALREDLNHSSNTGALIYWSNLGDLNNAQNLPNGATPLVNFVKCPAVLMRALSQIGFVENRETGARLAKDLLPGQILVTKSGDIWRWDGLTIKAEAPSSSALKLQQKNRLVELQKDIEKSQKDVDVKKAHLDSFSEKISSNNTLVQELKNDLLTTEREQREAREKLGSLQNELNALMNQQASTDASLDNIKNNIKQAREQLSTVLAQIVEMKDLEKDENEKRASSEKLDSLRQQTNEAQFAYNQLLSESNHRKARLGQVTNEINAAKSTSDRSAARVGEYKTRLDAATEKLTSFENGPDTMSSKRNELMNKIEEIEGKRKEKADILQHAENELRDVDYALKNEEAKLSDFREARAMAQATFQNASENNAVLRQDIFEKFESQPEHLLSTLGLKVDEDDLPSLEKTEDKLSKLIAERENMGPVNLRADIEATEIEEKINTLTKEKEELITAIHKLRGAIGRLNREARERLLEAFGKVDGHFQDLFTRLFGGGKAYLQLTDAEDPLDAGLEIFAQPPGKKLQNLSLLSGGEQTLTSIALVFAMFLTNPSPICVLDEIDAALDDANIDRVCALLDEMAKKGDTRFLVISHHRMTVARMDRLYGVTMAERGISQLVSVDLSQPDLLKDAA